MSPVRVVMVRLMPALVRSSVRLCPCWWARTEVGARRAHCLPFSTAWSMAMRAMMVLPEPTSPWRRRCMGWGELRSVAMVLMMVC